MRRRLLAVAAVLAASGGGVGVAAALTGDGDRPVTRSVRADAGGPPIVCSGASRPAAPDLTTRPPDPKLVALLGVLRRPRTAADAVPEKALSSLARPHVRGANVEAARLVREEPGGGRAWLVPVEDAVPRDVPPWRCVRRLRGEARDRAIAMRRQILRRPALAGAVVVADGDVVAPQGGTTEVIRTGRAFLTASCTGPARNMTTIAGIVPDGIERVHVQQAGGLRVDASVENNVVAVALPPSERAGALTAVFADGTGRTVRRPLGQGGIRHCAPRSATSTSRPRAPRRSPDGGAVELRTEPIDRGTGPVLAGVVRRPAGRRCLAIGPPVPREDARAPGVVPDAADLRCTSLRDLRRRRVVAGVVRLPGGVTVLAGFADPRRIRWVGIAGEREGLRATVSRSGAFAVAWRREFARGGTWRIRAALRGAPVRMTAPVTVRLRAKRPNETAVPPVADALTEPYAILRRPRTGADLFPQPFDPRGDRAMRLSPGGRGWWRTGAARRARGTDVWLVPFGRLLTIAVRPASAPGSMGGTTAEAIDPDRPPGSVTLTRRGDERRVHATFVFPDGVRGAVLELNNGVQVARPVRDNVFDVLAPGGPRRLTWRDGDGKRHSMRFRGWGG